MPLGNDSEDYPLSDAEFHPHFFNQQLLGWDQSIISPQVETSQQIQHERADLFFNQISYSSEQMRPSFIYQLEYALCHESDIDQSKQNNDRIQQQPHHLISKISIKQQERPSFSHLLSKMYEIPDDQLKKRPIQHQLSMNYNRIPSAYRPLNSSSIISFHDSSGFHIQYARIYLGQLQLQEGDNLKQRQLYYLAYLTEEKSQNDI